MKNLTTIEKFTIGTVMVITACPEIRSPQVNSFYKSHVDEEKIRILPKCIPNLNVSKFKCTATNCYLLQHLNRAWS